MYAIDFGTSNTVVCRWNDTTNAPDTLSLGPLSQALAPNPPLVPSLLYVKDAATGDWVLGQQVRDRGLDIATDARFFRNFKRGIGTDIRGFVPELDGNTVTFEQAGEWFLAGVVRQLQQQVGAVESLVITVPVDSFEAYRLWLSQVCAGLQVGQVRMLDEPTAAALGYGLEPGSTVLVVDFGGGTLDLSLVQLDKPPSGTKPMGFLLKWGKQTLDDSAQRPQVARVRGKAGQNLGGADIDNWLLDYFVQTQGIPVSPLTLRLAERLKIQLSTKTAASEAYFNDATLETYELQMERDRFQTLLEEKGFFQRLDAAMTQVLRQGRQQGVESEDIDAVLLVGGTAQIPAVQAWATQYFPAEKIRGDRPFEAIAHGALQLNQGLEVKDFLYHSYGIRYWDRRNNRHGWHPIVNEGQPYPMEQPVELFLGASTDNQPSIELVLGELGRSEAQTEVYFEGDRLVTRTLDSSSTTVKPLNDTPQARSIATLTPPGQPGSDRVKVLFQVDGDRFLRITVEDLFTGETLMRDRPVVQLS